MSTVADPRGYRARYVFTATLTDEAAERRELFGERMPDENPVSSNFYVDQKTAETEEDTARAAALAHMEEWHDGVGRHDDWQVSVDLIDAYLREWVEEPADEDDLEY